MTITNIAAIFTVPPMLVWMTELNSGVNVARFGILMLIFFLGSVLPAIVSITYIKDSVLKVPEFTLFVELDRRKKKSPNRRNGCTFVLVSHLHSRF